MLVVSLDKLVKALLSTSVSIGQGCHYKAVPTQWKECLERYPPFATKDYGQFVEGMDS